MTDDKGFSSKRIPKNTILTQHKITPPLDSDNLINNNGIIQKLNLAHYH